MTDEEKREEPQAVLMADFLEGTPPNRMAFVSDLSEWNGRDLTDRLQTPDIQLHCPNDACNGIRFFRCSKGANQSLGASFKFVYLTYICSNCQEHEKTYSIAARRNKESEPLGQIYKFGEMPPFGPPTPAKLISLIGPDRDVFLKGRRCENQGLGIGAFIYYRRVVEHQKNRILTEIVKVAEKIGTGEDKIATLNSAIGENQFSKALDMSKDAIPESLLINGHSPLRLLHSALSDGVHARTDEECLEIASSVRIVLGELSERLSQALKDEAELGKALATLMKPRDG